jgi:two-component system, OmpR family, response regulator PrrA
MNGTRCVLVVDDYAPSRYGFRRILTLGGYTVVEAADGAAATAALQEDIVAAVLDVNLPDVSGVELCRTIKQRQPALHVILISASYQAATRAAEWEAAGASAFLEQPIDATQLVETLDRLLAAPG